MVVPFYDDVTPRQALKEGLEIADESWLRAKLVCLPNAIDTIHRENCYNLDIALNNVLILKDGKLLLLDFGADRRVIGNATIGLTVIL